MLLMRRTSFLFNFKLVTLHFFHALRFWLLKSTNVPRFTCTTATKSKKVLIVGMARKSLFYCVEYQNFPLLILSPEKSLFFFLRWDDKQFSSHRALKVYLTITQRLHDWLFPFSMLASPSAAKDGLDLCVSIALLLLFSYA